VGYLPGDLKLMLRLQEERRARLREVPASRLTRSDQVRAREATVSGHA
jgi:hypothetical protein